MKPRKPIAGRASKEIQRTAGLRQQIADEKERHAAKEIDLGLQHAEHRLIPDLERRAIREVRWLRQKAEEDRRSRSALNRLRQRIARR